MGAGWAAGPRRDGCDQYEARLDLEAADMISPARVVTELVLLAKGLWVR